MPPHSTKGHRQDDRDVARRFVGAVLSRSNAVARKSYGSDLPAPDLSLMSVISGLKWLLDIIGSHRAADLQPPRRKVHEPRSYTYLYPDPAAAKRRFYHDADRSAARAPSTSPMVHRLKFDPTGGFSAYDPRQPTQEALERTIRWCAWFAKVGARTCSWNARQFTTSAIRLANSSSPSIPLGSKSRSAQMPSRCDRGPPPAFPSPPATIDTKYEFRGMARARISSN